MKLQLGCGPIHLPGWINIDIEPSHAPDVAMDYLRLSDRYEEGAASLVFSCHSIEHLEFPNGVIRALAQIFRVLRPGGVVRIVVPDLFLVAQKYVLGQDLKDIYGGTHYYWRDTPATRFLYFMREWSHTVVFDYALLSMMLRDAGFVNVRQMPFGKSEIPELNGLDRFQSESLIIQSEKPNTPTN